MAPDPNVDDLSDDEVDSIVKQGISDLNRTEKDDKVTVLECPECSRSDLSYVAGMETGHQYQCPHCGYQGALAVERERTRDELRRQAGMEP